MKKYDLHSLEEGPPITTVLSGEEGLDTDDIDCSPTVLNRKSFMVSVTV